MPDSALRVLHLVGSATSELLADLSLLYARDALQATADTDRYDPLLAQVAPDGAWRFPADLGAEALAAAEPVDVATAVDTLRRSAPDVALPQMFCVPGMTTYRSLLELLGIPFLGNRAPVMALGAHKARARAVVAAGGVAVPDGQLVRRGDPVTLTPPLVVKPAEADNSVGVTLVRDVDELPAALDAAFAEGAEVLVERFVPLGREVRCGVLERDGRLLVLPLEEYAVDERHKPIRDVADKLARAADGALGLVAKDAEHAWIVADDDELTGRVGAAALAAYRALGCRQYGLFDFRIDPAGRPWFLEAGLYCSFARQSVLAVMAAAAGIDVAELFAGTVQAALRDG